MGKHVIDLEGQLSSATSELDKVRNCSLYVASELHEINCEFKKRQKLNEERITTSTDILKELKEQNSLKESINMKLQKKLNDLVEHQQLLENRTKESIEQQNELKIKTEKINENINELHTHLGLVENDYQIQVDANIVQKERLGITLKS